MATTTDKTRMVEIHRMASGARSLYIYYKGLGRVWRNRFQAWAILCLLGFCVLTFGCASTGISVIKPDGEIDTNEAALIRIAVGLSLTAKPELVSPAYAVASSLIGMVDSGEISNQSEFDAALSDQIDKQGLTDSEKASAMEFIAAIKAQIVSELNALGIPQSKRIALARTALGIVRDAAAARWNTA